MDLYPNSNHVKTLALTNTDDSVIGEYAMTAKASSAYCGHFRLYALKHLGQSILHPES